MWLRRLLKELGFKQHQATTIYCDNQGNIKLTKNPLFHIEQNTLKYISTLLEKKLLLALSQFSLFQQTNKLLTSSPNL
jgi:hypothetical protein